LAEEWSPMDRCLKVSWELHQIVEVTLIFGDLIEV
jgi:hypothetical protein